MTVRIRREIRIALRGYLGMLSRNPDLRDPLRYIIKKHGKAIREMQRQAPKFSLRVTSVAAARAALAEAAKSGMDEVPDVGTPTVRLTIHAPKVEAFLKSRRRETGRNEGTRTVIATVIVILAEFRLVRIESPDGMQYAIVEKTPGIDWKTLHEGQHVECTVTTSDWPRALQARVC